MKSLFLNNNYKLTISKKENNKKRNNFGFFTFRIIKYIFAFFIIIFIITISSFKILKNYQKPEIIELNFNGTNSDIYLDKYEINIYNKINNKNLLRCSRMWGNQREFLNGVVRKFRPKKILEIGVAEGGSSVVILNAIQDIRNSHLYSIDLSTDKMIGYCIKKLFRYLNKNWNLYTGNIPVKFIEKIGRDIDMVMIDSGHYEPGEILDFLIILPFLKEEAIVVIHDIGNQITKAGPKDTRRNWAPYKIFNIIRGKKFFPSGNGILTHDIGLIKLEKNQTNYIHEYFRTLGGQWDYFLEEEHIKLIRNFIKKYYDNECLIMFEETIKFNREFVKNNPVNIRYIYDSFSKSNFLQKK